MYLHYDLQYWKNLNLVTNLWHHNKNVLMLSYSRDLNTVVCPRTQSHPFFPPSTVSTFIILGKCVPQSDLELHSGNPVPKFNWKWLQPSPQTYSIYSLNITIFIFIFIQNRFNKTKGGKVKLIMRNEISNLVIWGYQNRL